MATEPARGDQLETGVRIGDFVIERRLGAGGMGIVYQARQISLDRRVALKVLGPAVNHGPGLARFQREARAVARLTHPGIAALYFIGQDAELCYHVMELVEGASLRRVIDRLAATHEPQAGPDTVVSAEATAPPDAPPVRFDQPTTEEDQLAVTADNSPLSPAARQLQRSPQYVRRCVEIVRDAARALAYAHEAGVIHRDIKPENLMLDPNGRAHIIDFGLARFFDDVSITNTGQLVGTPLYMSPEQVTGRVKVDHRTDIYSLGLVLYELLTLRRPIDFTSRENLLRNIVTKALPPLCARNRSLPHALEAVVHKATHKDPEERYQSAAELADDLQRFLDGKPVSAPAYRYRFDVRDTVANRPGVVVLSAFLCFLVGAGAFVALASVGAMMAFITGLQGEGLVVALLQFLVALGALVGTALLGYGLLAGWNWARWVVVILSGATTLACLGGLLVMGFVAHSMIGNTGGDGTVVSAGEEVPGERPKDKGQERSFNARSMMLGMFAMYSVPLLLVLICAATSFISLLLPDTRAWFRLAGEARREHRALLRSFEA